MFPSSVIQEGAILNTVGLLRARSIDEMVGACALKIEQCVSDVEKK
jgi:hypothetical protein